MKFKRAEKYGFCAGVRLADQKVAREKLQGSLKRVQELV